MRSSNIESETYKRSYDRHKKIIDLMKSRRRGIF